MGTAAAERPEGSGFIAWLAHHEWVIYLAMTIELVAYLADGVVQAMGGRDLWWWITLTACLAVGLTAFILTLSIARHFQRLCEGCISAMPLNGPELAHRRKWVLTVHHFPLMAREWLQAWLGVRFIVGVLITTALYMGAVLGLVMLSGWLFRATSFGVAVMVASSIFLGVVGMWHRPLIPWCKWCNDGKGRGPREHICDPPPLPTISPDPVKVSS